MITYLIEGARLAFTAFCIFTLILFFGLLVDLSFVVAP